MSSNQITLKARNNEEIHQSLANYSGVYTNQIKIEDIQVIYNQYKNNYDGIADALWSNFNPISQKKLPDYFIVYRYHRTGTNGTKEWFLKGLQGQDRGIRSFISNLYTFYNIDLLEYENRLASKCLEKNELDDDNGPYAFMCYKFAQEHNGFRSAEVLSDIDVKLSQQVEKKLLPTIVTFWTCRPISELDKYLHHYCEMFLGTASCTTSFAINEDIPYEHIECDFLPPFSPEKSKYNNNELHGSFVFSPTTVSHK